MKNLTEYINESSALDETKIQEIMDFIDSLLVKKNYNKDDYVIKKFSGGIRIYFTKGLRTHHNAVSEIGRYIDKQLYKMHYEQYISITYNFIKHPKTNDYGLEYKYRIGY